MAITVKPFIEFGFLALLAACGGGGSGSASVSVPAPVTQNSAPIASAVTLKVADVSDTVTIDGSGSNDVNGDTLAFSWTLTSKPIGSSSAFQNSSSQKAVLIPDSVGTYSATLTVNDGKAMSAPVTVSFSVKAPYLTTSGITATPVPTVSSSVSLSNQSFWKLEFSGAETGYCQVIRANPSSTRDEAAYSEGMCVSKGDVLGSFKLSGITSPSGTITLNMLPNGLAPIGAMFSGALKLNGEGSGSWSIANTASQGTWTAKRFSGIKSHPIPNLANPDAGSAALSGLGLYGVWLRPSITNYPEIMLWSPTGEVVLQAASPRSGIGRTFGTMAMTGTDWSLQPGALLIDGGTSELVTAKGTVSPTTFVTGSMQSQGSNSVGLSFDRYADENAIGLDFKDLAGTYSNGEGSFEIKSDGKVTGTTGINGFSNCTLIGTVAPVVTGSRLNLYQVNLSYLGSCNRAQTSPSWYGIAYFATNGGETRYLYSVLRPKILVPGANVASGAFADFFGGFKVH